MRKHLHSRNNAVDIAATNFSQEKKIIDFKKIKTDVYYCSYSRLNQGVLLPSGEVNLSCQDYSLSSSIGNLSEKKLPEMYKHKEMMNNGFTKGNDKFCKNCEYYQAL